MKLKATVIAAIAFGGLAFQTGVAGQQHLRSVHVAGVGGVSRPPMSSFGIAIPSAKIFGLRAP